MRMTAIKLAMRMVVLISPDVGLLALCSMNVRSVITEC